MTTIEIATLNSGSNSIDVHKWCARPIANVQQAQTKSFSIVAENVAHTTIAVVVAAVTATALDKTHTKMMNDVQYKLYYTCDLEYIFSQMVYDGR